MANPISWRELHEKFVDGAVKFPDFQACWNRQLEQWTFEGGPALAEETFKEAARLAARLLREKGLTAPYYWYSWLNVMREQKRGFALVMQALTWRAAQDFMAGGETDSRHFRQSKKGHINCVFRQSADFCLYLEPLSADEIAKQQTRESKSNPPEQGLEEFSKWAIKRSAETRKTERAGYENPESLLNKAELVDAYPLRDHAAVNGEESLGDRHFALLSANKERNDDKSSDLLSATLAREKRAQDRRAVIMPKLSTLGWKRGTLASKAGVGKNSVYEYLDGTRHRISDENRQAIADALKIAVETLPE